MYGTGGNKMRMHMRDGRQSIAPTLVSSALNSACDSKLESHHRVSPIPRDIHGPKRAGSTLD